MFVCVCVFCISVYRGRLSLQIFLANESIIYSVEVLLVVLWVSLFPLMQLSVLGIDTMLFVL